MTIAELKALPPDTVLEYRETSKLTIAPMPVRLASVTRNNAGKVRVLYARQTDRRGGWWVYPRQLSHPEGQ